MIRQTTKWITAISKGKIGTVIPEFIHFLQEYAKTEEYDSEEFKELMQVAIQISGDQADLQQMIKNNTIGDNAAVKMASNIRRSALELMNDLENYPGFYAFLKNKKKEDRKILFPLLCLVGLGLLLWGGIAVYLLQVNSSPPLDSQALRVECLPNEGCLGETICKGEFTPARNSKYHFEAESSVIFGRIKITNTSEERISNIVCKLISISTLNKDGKPIHTIQPNLRLSWNYQWDPDPSEKYLPGPGKDLASKEHEFCDVFFTFDDCYERKGVYLRVQSVNSRDNELLKLNESYLLQILVSADDIPSKQYYLRVNFDESHWPLGVGLLG